MSQPGGAGRLLVSIWYPLGPRCAGDETTGPTLGVSFGSDASPNGRYERRTMSSRSIWSDEVETLRPGETSAVELTDRCR